ncbi:TPA: hypothetical protein P0E36_004878 [Vibrio harveyi]|nr:hypothetical protein [Vibrio harveyi]
MFTSYLRQADDLERAGSLRPRDEQIKQLTRHSSVSMTDKAREDFATSGKKHRFSDRIAALVKQGKPRGNDQ